MSRTTAGAQLSECSLAVAQMSQQVQLANSRLSGEHALQQASWERRLAVAQTEWEHAIDRLRGECASRLREADELLALRAEEATVAKDESKLLEAKLEFAHKEAAVRSNLLRQLLERVHDRAKVTRLNEAIDSLTERFGRGAVRRAGTERGERAALSLQHKHGESSEGE